MTRDQRRAADLAAAKAERWPPAAEVAREAEAVPTPVDPWNAWIAYRRTVPQGPDQEESAA